MCIATFQINLSKSGIACVFRKTTAHIIYTKEWKVCMLCELIALRSVLSSQIMCSVNMANCGCVCMLLGNGLALISFPLFVQWDDSLPDRFLEIKNMSLENKDEYMCGLLIYICISGLLVYIYVWTPSVYVCVDY